MVEWGELWLAILMSSWGVISLSYCRGWLELLSRLTEAGNEGSRRF